MSSNYCTKVPARTAARGCCLELQPKVLEDFTITELQTKVREDYTIKEKTPGRAFSWLNVPSFLTVIRGLFSVLKVS